MIEFKTGNILTEDAKQQFTPRQIGIAADTLSRKGWMREVTA